MFNDCPICQRLWNEYADATMTHATLKQKVEIAEFEHNQRAAQGLEPRMNAAEGQMNETRIAFIDHTTTHQTAEPKAKVLHARFSG